MKEIATWCSEWAERMSQKNPTNQPKPKTQPSEKAVCYCFQSLLASQVGKCPTVAPGVDHAAG